MTKTEQLAENYRQPFRGAGNHITSMDIREAYKDGAQGMLERACEWIKEHIDIPYEGRIIDGQPHAMDYIEWAEKRIEYANAVADAFKKTMEE